MKSQTIPIQFHNGIQPPAKLGTAIVKPTAEGYLSYAQNVDVHSDEYGTAVLLPGPSLPSVSSASEMTGVGFAAARTLGTLSASQREYVWVAQGVLGAKDYIRAVAGLKTGGTINVSSTLKNQIKHYNAAGADTGHTSIVLHDILFNNTTTYGNHLLIAGVDGTDGFVIRMIDTAQAATTGTQVTTLSGGTMSDGGRYLLFLGDDGNVYCNGTTSEIYRLVAPDYVTVTTDAFSLPEGKYTTAFGKFQTYMLIAVSDVAPGDFTTRAVGGTSQLIVWNYVTTTTYEAIVDCPSSYISVIKQDPSGNTLVFGGVNEGRCTMYLFTGKGFEPLLTYIGDLPRNEDSVDFDSQGRVLFQTVDGHICRFDIQTRRFEHLGTLDVEANGGALLVRLTGVVGQEFLATGGNSSTYLTKKVTFGNYLGDGDAADGVTTPLAIGGLTPVPPKSRLDYVTVNLQKNLVSGENLEVRLYKDGSTTSSLLGSLEFAVDGAIAGKKIYLRKYGLDNCAIGFAWKQTDAAATAPGVVSASMTVTPLR